MSYRHEDICELRTHHPAWRLLCSPQAPLIVAFLHRAFIAPNIRVLSDEALASALEDELEALRSRNVNSDEFSKPAQEYLKDWASPEKGWLREFYRQGSDEAQFDLQPATEKAIAWLGALTERSFVGTESRLLTLTGLLKQVVEGSEVDPKKRLEDLQRKRAEIDAEIDQVMAGNAPMLDDTGVKDRMQQFDQMSRALLNDFREVEENFRQLDRRMREKIARFEGPKAALLDQVLGEHDQITNSDQGRSFRAFFDLLMSPRRQDELAGLLAKALALPPVLSMKLDLRTKRVFEDWLLAAETTQRMVAGLSAQLCRFLDEGGWNENRRILDILRSIETRCLSLREIAAQGALEGEVAVIEDSTAGIDLHMERPLHTLSSKLVLADEEIEADPGDLDTSALYSVVHIDKTKLSQNVQEFLQDQSQVSLTELVTRHPLKHGLAELIAYLQLKSGTFKTTVAEGVEDSITWDLNRSAPNSDASLSIHSKARLERVIFTRAS